MSFKRLLYILSLIGTAQKAPKTITRHQRAGNIAGPDHTLLMTSPLPTQKVLLTITENKKQLIDLICKHLWDNPLFGDNSLVVTGSDPTPVEYNDGLVIRRNDLKQRTRKPMLL